MDAVYDGQDALDYGLSANYDGMILDIMMPGLDGLAVLKSLRERNVTVPVLMLTAKSELEDRIRGLDTGADDYLSKPFAMGELLARVQAMTRRKADYAPDVLEMGNIRLNRSSFELSNGSTALRLGNKEFQMLEMLLCAPERLIPAEQFIERISALTKQDLRTQFRTASGGLFISTGHIHH